MRWTEMLDPGVHIALALVALTLAVPGGASASSGGGWRDDSGLLNRAVPDIPLLLADGRASSIADVAGDKPLLVTFFYRRCTGVCMPLLARVREAVDSVGGLDVDYRVLAMSFDDADTVSDVHAQAEALGLLQSAGWSFAVAERRSIARIVGALDFWYRLDPKTQQYDHPALVVALDRGRMVRALRGSENSSARLRELIRELRGTFIPFYRVPGQTPLTCLAFDPRTGKLRLDWGMILLVLPGLAALAAVLTVFLGPGRRQRSC